MKYFNLHLHSVSEFILIEQNLDVHIFQVDVWIEGLSVSFAVDNSRLVSQCFGNSFGRTAWKLTLTQQRSRSGVSKHFCSREFLIWKLLLVIMKSKNWLEWFGGFLTRTNSGSKLFWVYFPDLQQTSYIITYWIHMIILK